MQIAKVFIFIKNVIYIKLYYLEEIGFFIGLLRLILKIMDKVFYFLLRHKYS